MDNRYLTQEVLPEIGRKKQTQLTCSKVLVIGCGGLAATVLPYLCASGVGNITIIDNDTISLSNLNRQVLFNESDLNLPKVLIAKQQLEKQNSEIRITALNQKFDLNNGIDLSNEHDLVIDCSDNYETKVAINYCSIMTKTPFVYASVLGWDGQVALFTSQTEADPCYKCLQKLAPQTIKTCNQNGVLGSSVSLVGSYQASLAIQYLLGYSHNANFLYIFDLWTLEHKKLKLAKRDGCKFHKQSPHKLNYISYNELLNLKNYVLLDIRTYDEWVTGHLPKAQHATPGNLINQNSGYTTKENLIIYCNSEQLSKLVVENLQSIGYNALILKGGYLANQDFAVKE